MPKQDGIVQCRLQLERKDMILGILQNNSFRIFHGQEREVFSCLKKEGLIPEVDIVLYKLDTRDGCSYHPIQIWNKGCWCPI